MLKNIKIFNYMVKFIWYMEESIDLEMKLKALIVSHRYICIMLSETKFTHDGCLHAFFYKKR